ncbi:hypothetical protein E4T56_gene5578 [Termitomyces sp. T112]|nr:hypothetical protein E4T56_gene5578 [Termitomyces sp. T112]
MLQGPPHSSTDALPTAAPSAKTPAPTPMGAPWASVLICLVLRHEQPMPHQGGHSVVRPSLNSSVLPHWLATPHATSLPLPRPPLPLQLPTKPLPTALPSFPAALGAPATPALPENPL